MNPTLDGSGIVIVGDCRKELRAAASEGPPHSDVGAVLALLPAKNRCIEARLAANQVSTGHPRTATLRAFPARAGYTTHMPPDASGPFNVRARLRAWCLFALALCASAALLAFPHPTEAALTDGQNISPHLPHRRRSRPPKITDGTRALGAGAAECFCQPLGWRT